MDKEILRKRMISVLETLIDVKYKPREAAEILYEMAEEPEVNAMLAIQYGILCHMNILASQLHQITLEHLESKLHQITSEHKKGT